MTDLISTRLFFTLISLYYTPIIIYYFKSCEACNFWGKVHKRCQVLISHNFHMTTLVWWWWDDLTTLEDFYKLLIILSPSHEGLPRCTSQRKHDDLFGGSSYLGPTPDPEKHKTHVPRTEDLEGQLIFPRVLEDNPHSQSFVQWPHIHPHERPWASFQQRSRGQTSYINDLRLYQVKVCNPKS